MTIVEQQWDTASQLINFQAKTLHLLEIEVDVAEEENNTGT
jgi:hypothetical protein